MIPRAYKPTLFLLALLVATAPVFAQDTTAAPDINYSNKNLKLLNIDLGINRHDLNLAMNDLNMSLKEGIKDLNSNLHIWVPELKELSNNISVSINNNLSDEMVRGGNISEKVKSYSKSYPMDGNDRLTIDNRFGDVTVKTWNKPEVKVDIEIKSYADNDATAQKMIDAISISDNKSGDVVSFRTNFGSGSSNSVWDLFNNRNDHHKAEVNYTIYMPSKNGLGISNHYGSIELPDFEGKVSIESSYGSFSGKSLMHPDNEIKVRYGSASIESLSSGDVSVNYGSLDLGSIEKLNAEFRYSPAKIGKIKTSANINAHYSGGIDINSLDKNFSSFSYSSNYSNIKIGVENSTNANFDVTVRYGSFDYDGVPVEITEKTPSDDSKGWKPTKNFKGHIGKGGGGTINISSTYGGVKFE